MDTIGSPWAKHEGTPAGDLAYQLDTMRRIHADIRAFAFKNGIIYTPEDDVNNKLIRFQELDGDFDVLKKYAQDIVSSMNAELVQKGKTFRLDCVQGEHDLVVLIP